MATQLKRYIERFDGSKFVLIGKENSACNDEEERSAWVQLILNEKENLCNKDEHELREFHICWLEYHMSRCRALLFVKGGKLLCRVIPVNASLREITSIILTVAFCFI
jgi:hypothetical protein